MGRFTSIPLVHNYLWPALMGLVGAVVTALTSGAPAVLADGIQPGDLAKLGGIVLAAVVAFGATIMQRYAGGKESWGQPTKTARQNAGIGGEPFRPLDLL